MTNDEAMLKNQQLINIGLLENSIAKNEQNANLRHQLRSIDAGITETRQQREQREDLEIENISLKNEVDFYKNLLAKPMHQIAAANSDFKKTYEVQQELLANWMVSQRAFKELAIDFGMRLGQEKNETVDQGMLNRTKVIENKTHHGNDLGDDFYVKPFVEKIKIAILNKI